MAEAAALSGAVTEEPNDSQTSSVTGQNSVQPSTSTSTQGTFLSSKFLCISINALIAPQGLWLP